MTELQRLQLAVGEKRREVRMLALDEKTETEALEMAESELTLLERRAETLARVEGGPESDPPNTSDAEGREIRKLRGRGVMLVGR